MRASHKTFSSLVPLRERKTRDRGNRGYRKLETKEREEIDHGEEIQGIEREGRVARAQEERDKRMIFLSLELIRNPCSLRRRPATNLKFEAPCVLGCAAVSCAA